MTETADPSDILRIAIVQENPTVGNVNGNLELARRARADAARHGADLVLFTELFLSGYPPEDLVLKPAFLRACDQALNALAQDTADGGPGVVIGVPRQTDEGRFNAVALLDGGKIVSERYKVDLPNYSEFDEKRVFDVGPMPGPVNFRGIRIGLPICEDIWGDFGVCETLAETGAELLLVANGSPYYRDKTDVRQQVALRQVIESGLPLIFANQLGGQDELVFDGASFALNADKSLAFQMSQFEAQTVVTTWRRGPDGWTCSDGPMSRLPETEEADYPRLHAGPSRLRQTRTASRMSCSAFPAASTARLCAALAGRCVGRGTGEGRSVLPYHYTFGRFDPRCRRVRTGAGLPLRHGARSMNRWKGSPTPCPACSKAPMKG